MALRGSSSEKNVTNPVSNSLDVAESSNSPPVGRIYCAGYTLGDINLFHGVPFLSSEGQKWIGFWTGENNAAGETHGPLWQNQRQAWHKSVLPENLGSGTLRDLPPRNVTEQYLEVYQNSDVSSLLPLADPVIFPEVIERAYNSNSSSSDDFLPARACVFSFLALVSLIGIPNEKNMPLVDVSGCVTAAQLLFPDILNARASTAIVDALMMLVSCTLFNLPVASTIEVFAFEYVRFCR